MQQEAQAAEMLVSVVGAGVTQVVRIATAAPMATAVSAYGMYRLATYICPFKIEDFLFYNRRGHQMTNNTIKMFVSKLQKKLGFKLSSRKLRHNFATNYVIDQYEQHGIADMISLQYLMGHADLSTTQNYLHIAQQHLACQNSISHLDKVL